MDTESRRQNIGRELSEGALSTVKDAYDQSVLIAILLTFAINLVLGTFLVIGFTLHNITEGLAIVVPIAKNRPRLWHFAALGAVAGVPTIFGTWIGGFSYSPIFATLFLAIGAGAIFQVVYVIGKLMIQEAEERFANFLNFSGLALGMIIMYTTALFVVG